MIKRVLILLLLGLSPLGLAAKDWYIERVETDAFVRLDGRIELRELRTYRFEGSYSRASMDIRKVGFDRLHHIRVIENGVPYVESTSKEPGHFHVRDRRRVVEIQWQYAAKDETRTFEIRYELDGAIVTGGEHAEWYWSFIGNKLDRSTLTWSMRTRFEWAGESEPIHIWAHGDTSNLSALSGYGGQVEAHAGRIDRRMGIRIRMVFPASWVPHQDMTDGGFTLAAALADEESKAESLRQKSEREAVIGAVFRDIVWLLIIGPILTWAWMFNRYGRRHAPLVRIPDVGHTPPSDLPPAIVSWFLGSRVVQSHALVATLMDLGRKGLLRIETTEQPSKWGKPKQKIRILLPETRPDTGSLLPHERMLLDRITVDTDLEALFPAHQGETATWYGKWSQSVAADAKAMGWFDKESRKGMYASAAITTVMLIASVSATVYLGAWAAVAIVSSVMALIASAFIERRTPQGETAFAVWSAYRTGLKTGNKQELSAAPTGRHLVYAVAFGITGKRLTERLSILDEDRGLGVWLKGTHPNPALFAQQIGSMVASATVGVVSGTAASGGSSGGGGGGGAG